jgi:hypothetical protein
MGTASEMDNRYLLSLIKEATSLTSDLAKMDKKMEADILKQRGALAVWWEENIEGNKAAGFAVDQAVDYGKGKIPYGLGKPAEEALKFVFKSLFKTLKYSNIAVSAALAPFGSDRQPTYKAAYLDSRFGAEYYVKQERLAQIYRELFQQMPPSSISLEGGDKCAIEACWRQR